MAVAVPLRCSLYSFPRACVLDVKGAIAHIMSYDFHIERAGERPIALTEWRAAIVSTDGVRLFAGAVHTITNPKTGEVISIVAGGADVEVLFPNGEWRSIFRWRDDSAIFAARFNPSETSHPVWRAAIALATSLQAVIRGDGGEAYDLNTGEVTDA